MTSDVDLGAFVRRLPKAELHLHLEGTLEPELLLELAGRNRVDVGHSSAEALRATYRFADLQAFLDLYYRGTSVLHTEADFADLTAAYLTRAAADGVRHAEIFVDPQSHTTRGVPLDVVVAGIGAAVDDRAGPDPSVSLVACFLRDRGPDEAMATLEEVLALGDDRIVGVGLDSAEQGHPPSPFADVFARARAEGLRLVAHAGEEGPPAYIREALDSLHVARIDHGVRCLEDPALVARLRDEAVPLTVCPLSNVALGVVNTMAAHPLTRLLDAGLRVTLNSDDPAYFGGYVADNYLAAADAFGLGPSTLTELARNSIRASFLDHGAQGKLLADIDAVTPSR